MPERVCVFVDGSNFYHACRSQLGRADIRIGDFARWLVGAERTLIRTYYYNCPLPPDAPEEAKRSRTAFVCPRRPTCARRHEHCRGAEHVESRG